MKSMFFLQKIFYKKYFNDRSYRKVIDHCHYTGKYRVPGHSICNLKFNVSSEISVAYIMVQNTNIILLLKFEGPF